jgi:hypothetical protein
VSADHRWQEDGEMQVVDGLSQALGSIGHAWQIWAAGQNLQSYWLLGHQVLWWGRMGKVLDFGAGLVVVLDIIGPRRLDAFSVNLKRAEGPMGSFVAYAVTAGLFAGAVAVLSSLNGSNWADKVVATVGGLLFGALAKLLRRPAGWLAQRISDVFEPNRLLPVVRVGSLTLLAIGFQFDLLAS